MLKKTFVLSLMLSVQVLLPGHLHAQELSCNVVDAKGLRQGYWKLSAAITHNAGYMPNQIVSEGNFTDSKFDGVWIHYYSNGNVAGEVSWKKGRRHGITKYFLENAVIKSSCEFREHKRDGKMTTYYPDGKILMEYTWSEGRINGPAKTYYPNGNVCEEGTWKGNCWSGNYKLYNTNGTLKREVHLPVIWLPEDATF